MLSNLGRSVIKAKNVNHVIGQGSQYVKRVAPLTPSIAVRTFSLGTTSKLIQQDPVVNKVNTSTMPLTPSSTSTTHASSTAKTTQTEAQLLKTLEEFKITGNLKGAIKTVQNARTATPALYLYLVDMLRELPFDVQECATVVHWFYSTDAKLPFEVQENLDVWKSVLKLGFRFGTTYRAEDLRALVDRFTEIFDLTQLNDQTAWELLMRAYGIMNRKDAITACMNKNENTANKKSFYSSALLSYAATNSNENVEKILSKLKEENLLSERVLLKLIRCYGFQGDIQRTSKYMEMHQQLFNKKEDKTMLLIAHKIALEKMCKQLEHTRGSRGLPLKPTTATYAKLELDELNKSWNELTKDMFSNDQQSVDIIDCNVVLEYLTFANRIDPIEYPMKKAEYIFESYMPSHNIKPNDASHRIMLVGYATSQEYNNKTRNVRLDKTLEVVSKMQVAGLDTLNHPTFHALFRACLPYTAQGQYYFDNFRLNSLLPARPLSHNKFKLDSRVFEIEKIMLEAQLPHDRFTFAILITCLAAGGKNQAFRSRWRTLKTHGLRRDVGLYRLAFALSSLHPTQAKRAITVFRSEMNREVPKDRLDWDTYTAMLDCCITAQSPQEAQEIMGEMKHYAQLAYKQKAHADDLSKWPFLDSPDFYLPLLRTCVSIKGLSNQADKILAEMDKKEIIYNQGIWEAKLSKLALEGNTEGIRHLFNKYTMSRFEKEGKIPVPVNNNTTSVVPFPTAPYTKLDMEFIDVYIASLLDNQNLSLVFDVLKTLSDQTNEIGISRKSLQGIVRLAKEENVTKEELKWLSDTILPKITNQNKEIRLLKKNMEYII